jgi:Ca-activated chloride channel family protein
MTTTRPLPRLIEALPVQDTEGDEPGFGALETAHGRLPLASLDVRGRIDGLLAQVTVRQTFVNAASEALEATYIFPLPDRAAVTAFRMEVDGRVVEGTLRERARARRAYAQAVRQGHRASIAEEERPGVFTLRVGNLMPGERATVQLTMAWALSYKDGEVTFRFPLVVAPRYIPGLPLSGLPVGTGVALDTDRVPDASRISPPVLLPGFPNPVRLSLAVELYETAAQAHDVQVSLHAVWEDITESAGARRIVLQPGDRLDRDFILRFRLGGPAAYTSLSLHPDAGLHSQDEGTFALTIVPPFAPGDRDDAGRPRPRDVALVLDRSGSMEGWKMVAARRAMARVVDTLNDADRFVLLAFDDHIETHQGSDPKLTAATDRNRFRAVEFLAVLRARGGTEIASALRRAVRILDESRAEPVPRSQHGQDHDRILVLVTDGQVGNEDEVMKVIAPHLGGVRVFTIGIDQAVNEGFLNRLAGMGASGGSCELVESEARLDAVMESIHRRIAAPLLTHVQLLPGPAGFRLLMDSLVPDRPSCLFAGSPLLILGRYQGRPTGQAVVRAQARDGTEWQAVVEPSVRDNPAITAAWARGRVRQLEDRYAIGAGDLHALEQAIVEISLRYGVLCRFTAYVALDRAAIVNEGGEVHQVTQPVEIPAGWAPDVEFTEPGACAALTFDYAYHSPEMHSSAALADETLVSSFEPLSAGPSGALRSMFGAMAWGRSEVPSAAPPSEEEQLAHAGYTLVHEVARDEFGTVYKAADLRRRPVSIRVLKSPATLENAKAVARLQKKLAGLKHAAIVRLYELVVGSSSPDRVIAITAESLGLWSIEEWLSRRGTIAPRQAAAMVLLLAEGLEYAAGRLRMYGLIWHQDIRIAEDGSPRIADLALAPLGLRQPGSEASDVQSLGFVLGRLALPGVIAGAVGPTAASVPLGELAPPSREFWKTPARPSSPRPMDAGIPIELEAICRKAVEPDAARRYAAVAELAADLRQFLGIRRRRFFGKQR